MKHIVISLAMILPITATAAPPAGQPVDPDMHDWYQSLRQPNTGRGCCSIADCRPYDSRINNDHYEIKLNERWYPVPNEVVLHRENRTGNAIACLSHQWNFEMAPAPRDYDPGILCFVPSWET